MSAATDRLPRVDLVTVGIGVAAIVAILGIVSVFTSALDLSSLVQNRFRITVGLVGVGLGAVMAKGWIDAEEDGYRPPDRERVLPVSVPGDEFDELLWLRSVATSTESIRYYRSESRDELLAVAIEVLELHRGYSEDEARERLRDGSWTDDPVAREFFQYGGGSEVSEQLSNTVRRSRGSDHPYTRRARRTIDVLDGIVEGER